jgi:hypothetical protein
VSRVSEGPCVHVFDFGTRDERRCHQWPGQVLHQPVEEGCPLPGNHHAFEPPPEWPK